MKRWITWPSSRTHYWKPLAANTIFVTQENPTKRREYEDQVVKVFYLSNITSPQELQEVITTLRQVIEVNKLFNYSSQNAIIVRAEPARMALVEKIIADLDKPKAEVLVDVMVMEVDSTRSRQLAAAFAPTGINSPIAFTPRTSLQTLAGQLGPLRRPTTGFSNNGTGTTPPARRHPARRPRPEPRIRPLPARPPVPRFRSSI